MNRPTFNGLLAVTMACAAVGCAPQNQANAQPAPAPVVVAQAPAGPRPAPAPQPAPTPAPAPSNEPVMQVVGNQVRGKLYFPTGEAAGSTLLLEKNIPTEVQVNKPFTYDIKVTNISKLKLEDVEVSETVPGTFRIKDLTEGSPDGKPNTVNIAVGTLNPGDSKIVRLTGTAMQSGSLGMALSAKYNTSLVISTNVVAPALKLAMSGSTDVAKSDQLGYKLTVTNSGSGDAKNVKVESVLPDGLVTPDGKAAVSFDAGTLSSGESRDFAFAAKANKTGTFEIKATARGEDLASEPVAVKTAVKAPWLQISKTGPEKAFIGQLITYEISVTNKGDGLAKETVIYDNLPANVAVQAASENARSDAAGKVRWDVGNLPPGETKKVQVVVTASAAGEMKSVASVSASGAETQVSDSMKTVLSGVPAIAVQMIDGPDPVLIGKECVYTIEVTNQGTAAGTNIKLVCSLEDPADFVRAEGQTKETVSGKTITFAPLASLAPKQKATYKVTVKAVKNGDVRFKSTITSDQLTRPVEQSESTNFIGG